MNFNKILQLLTEKIKITETDYGNKYNFTNRKFSREHGDIFTFFIHEGHEVVVELALDSLNFAILDKRGEANYLHTQSNIRIKNIQEFYGKILYVFRDMVKEFNIDYFKIYAHPTEIKTSKLYNSFVKNPNLIDIVKNIGFKYSKIEEVEDSGHTFKVYMFSKKDLR